jgi:AcrR family transcriptional regulator
LTYESIVDFSVSACEDREVGATTEEPSRVQRKRERRRQEILAVAAGLIGERGYDAMSLDDVAARLDVTKGSLYHYFAGKEDLASAAIETLGAAWTARLADLLAATPGTASLRLRALMREQLVIAVRDHPGLLGLFLTRDDRARNDRAYDDHAGGYRAAAHRAAIKELRRAHDRLFRDLVEEGVAAGEFVVVDLDTTLRCLHAAMTQASTWYGGLRGAALGRALDGLVDTLMMLVGEGPRVG